MASETPTKLAREAKEAIERLKQEETEKRGWQFVFIGAGAGPALIGGIVVQLVAFVIKK